MDFNLDSMAAHLLKLSLAMPTAEAAALHKAAEIVETEAKAEIGSYQGSAGPFAAWAPLKESTISRKANGDTPLLETGEMRDSIGSVVINHEAHIGSNNDKAVWQELGTSRGIPPRSFLGGAAVRKSGDVRDAIGHTMHGSLLGSGQMIPIK